MQETSQTPAEAQVGAGTGQPSAPAGGEPQVPASVALVAVETAQAIAADMSRFEAGCRAALPFLDGLAPTNPAAAAVAKHIRDVLGS